MQPRRPNPSTRNILSLLLIVLGVIVTVLALLADRLEIGTGQGFGYYQMIVLIVGIVLLLGGGAMMLQNRSGKRSGDDFTV